jgi:hypothetical protein
MFWDYIHLNPFRAGLLRAASIAKRTPIRAENLEANLFACVSLRYPMRTGSLAIKKTTVSHAWIAEQLAMRSPANVSLALHRRKQELKGLPAELRKFIVMQSDAH